MNSKEELLKQYLTPLDASTNSEYLQPNKKKKKRKKVLVSKTGMKVVDLDELSTVVPTLSERDNENVDQGCFFEFYLDILFF
jgi:HD superfamily phosphohydrolase